MKKQLDAPSTSYSVGRGQPRKISLEIVKDFIDQSRLELLDVSIKTLPRWRKENNYQDPKKTEISDDQLDTAILSLITGCGRKRRMAIARVDSEGRQLVFKDAYITSPSLAH